MALSKFSSRRLVLVDLKMCNTPTSHKDKVNDKSKDVKYVVDLDTKSMTPLLVNPWIPAIEMHRGFAFPRDKARKKESDTGNSLWFLVSVDPKEDPLPICTALEATSAFTLMIFTCCSCSHLFNAVRITGSNEGML